ncbi:SLX9 domain containing protein [Asbolus verrucosus]|uniref:SLX9 domain containing protein n=1 Tax=Asbolus verrucosus TaxID=1661398 RepID=A0A482V810_ASBVE|nr:SLX9 domain containing protein [Asbolus verrucosus]
MGKQRRQRKKFHLDAKTARPNVLSSENSVTEAHIIHHPLMESEGNIFEGLHIDIDSLNKKLAEDTQSVKSFKSVKSELGKSISKKDKLKMRREMFLKKFEIMNQMKQEKKLLSKRKNTPVVGDMNPLHDALPSLESLLKTRSNIPYKQNSQPKKLRGIEKASKQKKNQLQGIKMFQQIFRNKQFQKDPHVAISQHVKAVLEHEKSS